jgi:nucleoside-diphosphate-sugar epimerase
MALSKEKQVFVLGAGFIGKPLAINLEQLNYNVSVSIRNSENNASFTEQGIAVHNFQVGDAQVPIFSEIQTLVIAYPIGSRRMQIGDHLKQAQWIAEHFPKNQVKQVILTSSTSVYPDGMGEVDENCAARPTDHGLIQLEYEEALCGFYGAKLVVLRLAGLIGKNRHPGRFLAGKKDVSFGSSPINMVHQGDVVRFIVELITRQITVPIINLCHDDHLPKHIYYRAASKALNLEPPTFSAQTLERPKLVNNTLSRSLFGFEYEFPVDLF